MGLVPHTAAVSWGRRSFLSPCMVFSPMNTGMMPAVRGSRPTLDEAPAEVKESKGIFLKNEVPCQSTQEDSRGCQALR